MKKMRKIFAVLLTLAMVIAMSIPTFAEGKSATITVTGLDEKATVTYTQIIEPDVTTETGWKFTNSSYASVFSATDSEQTIIWKLLKMKTAATMQNEPAGITAYTAEEFAKAIANITTNTVVTDEEGQPKKAGTAGEISWNVDKAGIYVVNATSQFEEGDAAKYTYSTMAGYVSFGTYDTATGVPTDLVGTTITAKSSSIDITKENDEKDKVVEVGKVVEYTVKTKIPYVNDVEPITEFKVTDTITGAEYVTTEENGKNMLALNVTIGSESADQKVEVTNNSFTLDLSSYLAGNAHANQSVVIKYSAKVTGTEVGNTVKWTDGGHHSGTATDKLYTGTVTLTKTGEHGKKLENAEFVLVRKENNALKYAVARKADDKAEYTVTGWVENQTNATTMSTDVNGNIVVKGLDDSTVTYEFKETKAPEGYSVNTTNSQVSWATEGDGAAPATRTGAASMTDTKLNALPSTGGIGTTIFTIAGCAIMVAAAGLFFASRKRTSK